MRKFVDAIEGFLLLDTIQTHSQLIRARAVYLISSAFILTQFVNLFAMTMSYGEMTTDHLVSIIACFLVCGTMLMLRWTKRYWIFAAIYSALIIGGVMASALPEQTGINSALLPFFILGIIANGCIAGWRAALMFAGLSFAAVWYLWWVSLTGTYLPVVDAETFAARNFQRAVQTSLAILLISSISALFAYHMDDAFEELESGIEQARESDRAKTDFLATMSHELFTPMNGIISLSDVLAESNLTPDQRELADLIRKSGADLEAIISNVLTFSQLEAGKIALSDDPFNLAAAAKAAALPYQEMARAKDLRFDISIAENLPASVRGDRMRVKQIITALADNAVKFTDRGGVQMSVLCAPMEGEQIAVVIAMRDTGIGISERDLDRIYDRFTQVDGSIKRIHGGTGLGLTVAQGLAREMNGTIAAQSREGAGSIFTAKIVLGSVESAAGRAEVALAAE